MVLFFRLLEQSEVDFLGTVTSDPMFGTIIGNDLYIIIISQAKKC